MAGDKVEVLLVGPPKPTIVNGLASLALHRLGEAKDRDALLQEVGGRVRAIASSVTAEPIGGELMGKLPRLEILSTFGVGYDHVDLTWAIEHGVTVANLSLSSKSERLFPYFHEVVDSAYFKQVSLVCAVNNVPAPTYPGEFSSVISVAAGVSQATSFTSRIARP
jgi:hypothetical protein